MPRHGKSGAGQRREITQPRLGLIGRAAATQGRCLRQPWAVEPLPHWGRKQESAPGEWHAVQSLRWSGRVLSRAPRSYSNGGHCPWWGSFPFSRQHNDFPEHESCLGKVTRKRRSWIASALVRRHAAPFRSGDGPPVWHSHAAQPIARNTTIWEEDAAFTGSAPTQRGKLA